MEMAGRKKQLIPRKSQANLAPLIDAQRQSVQTAETQARVLFGIAQQATDVAVADAKRQSTKQGSKEGAGGYQEKKEIFSWDRAYNDSAQTAFESTAKSSLSNSAKLHKENLPLGTSGGAITELTKRVNKDRDELKKNAQSKEQKDYIDAIASTSIASQIPSTIKQVNANSVAMFKGSWTGSKDYNSEQVANIMTQYSDDPLKAHEMLTKLQDNLINEASAGIKIGAISAGMALVDIKGITAQGVTAVRLEEYKNADDETRTELRDRARQKAEVSSDNPLAVENSLGFKHNLYEEFDKIDTKQFTDENREVTRNSQEQKAFNLKSQKDIRSAIFNKDDNAINLIEDAYRGMAISRADRDAYMTALTVGVDYPQADNLSTYKTIKSNLEDFTTDEILQRTDLTEKTMKKLLDDRVKWEEDGEEFYNLTASKEGKNNIRDAYGFTKEAGLFDFSGDDANYDKYVEMQDVLAEFNELVRQDAEQGKHNTGVIRAKELLERQDKVPNSKLYSTYNQENINNKKDMLKAVKKTGKPVEQIIEESPKDSVYDADVEEVLNPPPVEEEIPRSEKSWLDGWLSDKAEVRRAK